MEKQVNSLGTDKKRDNVQHCLRSRTCKSGPKSIGWTTAELAAVDAADATADADVAEEETTADDEVVPELDDAAPVSMAGHAEVSVVDCAAGEGSPPRVIRDSRCCVDVVPPTDTPPAATANCCCCCKSLCCC